MKEKVFGSVFGLSPDSPRSRFSGQWWTLKNYNRTTRQYEAARSTTNRSVMAQKSKTNKPVHQIQLGRIRAAIWANTAKKGGVWFNVVLTRRFKEGDEWQDTTTFGCDDLPLVSKAADMAYAWIWEQTASANPDKGEQE
ncbi:hypothetical protein [Planctomicrobium sp. SH527]|uniref:hypothetical protein n=1 Tax=Planctomicrobium sp. SH527 TaxID=3448123 RepID=UPI003F5B4B11